MPSPAVDPRLRTAVDASLQWYVALFAVHAVRCVIDRGLLRALDPPPRLHSAVLTLEPGLSLADTRLLGLADNFADQDLDGAGMRVLFEATWLHRAARATTMPSGWARVTTRDGLAEWNAAGDTASVVVPELLANPTFSVLEHRADGLITMGCIATLGTGVVHLSHVRSTTGHTTDWQQVVDAASATYPGRPLVGYEHGADLTHAREIGFLDVGPKRVWVPSDGQRM